MAKGIAGTRYSGGYSDASQTASESGSEGGGPCRCGSPIRWHDERQGTTTCVRCGGVVVGTESLVDRVHRILGAEGGAV
jgi:hypothetical protein